MAVGTRRQRQRQEELWYRRDLAYPWLEEAVHDDFFSVLRGWLSQHLPSG